MKQLLKELLEAIRENNMLLKKLISLTRNGLITDLPLVDLFKKMADLEDGIVTQTSETQKTLR